MAKNMIIEHFICFRKVLIIVGEQKKIQQNWAKIGKDMALQTSEFFIFIHEQKFFANFYESIRWSRGPRVIFRPTNAIIFIACRTATR